LLGMSNAAPLAGYDVRSYLCEPLTVTSATGAVLTNVRGCVDGEKKGEKGKERRIFIRIGAKGVAIIFRGLARLGLASTVVLCL
jgi:hypothetical protein